MFDETIFLVIACGAFFCAWAVLSERRLQQRRVSQIAGVAAALVGASSLIVFVWAILQRPSW